MKQKFKHEQRVKAVCWIGSGPLKSPWCYIESMGVIWTGAMEGWSDAMEETLG